jgi:hypothetical protein
MLVKDIVSAYQKRLCQELAGSGKDLSDFGFLVFFRSRKSLAGK